MQPLSARRLSSVVATAVAVAVIAGAPVARGQDPARPNSRVAIRGAGATFPAPLYEAWIKRFAGQHPDVALVYDAVGSGEGQRRFLAQTVDFGASDAALSDEQIASARSGASLVPVTAGMVVLAYNLPGLGGPLKLPRGVYVDMFAGRIRTWNDARLVAANPSLALPARTIALVARQDASGTTFAMTNHLSAVSDAWRDRGPGVGNLVDWRGAVMLARGNEGVAARIKVSEGAIGYVEYHFARRLGLPMAHLENRAGRFVEPTEASGQTALARNATKMPPNRRLFLPDPEGADAYPIVTFSWLLLQDRYPDPHRAAALKKFVAWCLTDGQGLSRELGYIPLPAEVASISLAAVDRIE
jgi:phosphate transport system substrate-binding protein